MVNALIVLCYLYIVWLGFRLQWLTNFLINVWPDPVVVGDMKHVQSCCMSNRDRQSAKRLLLPDRCKVTLALIRRRLQRRAIHSGEEEVPNRTLVYTWLSNANKTGLLSVPLLPPFNSSYRNWVQFLTLEVSM